METLHALKIEYETYLRHQRGLSWGHYRWTRTLQAR